MKHKYKKLFIRITVISAVLLQYSVTPRNPKEDKFGKYVTRFRAVDCKNLHNSTAYITKCFIKNYSRSVSTLNFAVKTVKPLVNIYLQLVVSYRYGNIYREVMDTKVINWCEVQHGSMFNPLLNFILDVIRESVPNLFHECPYEGFLEFYNITVNDDLAMKMAMFSDGQYKFNATIYDRPNRIFSILTVFNEIKSPLKTSFG